jgi:hypothetical protein
MRCGGLPHTPRSDGLCVRVECVHSTRCCECASDRIYFACPHGMRAFYMVQCITVYTPDQIACIFARILRGVMDYHICIQSDVGCVRVEYASSTQCVGPTAIRVDGMASMSASYLTLIHAAAAQEKAHSIKSIQNIINKVASSPAALLTSVSS